MNIIFTVQRADGVAIPEEPPSISAEANYWRVVPVGEEDSNDPVPQALRVALDPALTGATVLEDAASQQVMANVLAVDGSLIFSRMVIADSMNTAALLLTQADVDFCTDRPQAVPTDTTEQEITRKVRLIETGGGSIDYARSSVVVSAVLDPASITAKAIEPLLNVGDKISAIEVTGHDLTPLTSVMWTPAHLAVDGTFDCGFPEDSATGWLWWLAGDRHVLGFVPDDLSKQENREFAIALPVLSNASTTTGLAPAARCEDIARVPVDVTESELAGNPGIYTEDPGAFCKPFSNPERVLSEKSFSVIARVTQPEIGALPSAKTKSVKLLALEGDETLRSGGDRGGFFGLFRRASISAPALAARIPTRHIMTAYKTFVESLPSGRGAMDANHPVQWEDDIAQYQAATISLGHILEFRIRWRSNGYSLGTVAKTLTLAPRQAKRIQKVEWERSERARRRERTTLTDVENDTTTRERDYQDHVAASLSEWAMGASHSDVEGIAGGIGFFAEVVLGGVGGGIGSANSSSFQEGGRNTSASEHQRLRDAIRRHGDALRKFESTVVTEVTQEETVTGTTEVVRNLNYAHSLTVIYYQILRHLRVDTEFAGARECLFVPFAVKPFDLQRVYRWREPIQASIRSRRFLRALRYLKDVVTNFTTSDIPPGTRAQQPLTFVRGSIYLNLAINRPADGDEGSFDAGSWSTIQHLLHDPAQGVHSGLSSLVSAARDLAFQTRFAPSVAASWSNRLELKLGSHPVHIDSTLATRYQFNRGVRIDFVVPPEELAGLERADLQTVTVVPLDDLPPGSVANLTRISLTYNTTRFEHSVQGRTGVNDLINPTTGAHDNAVAQVPLDHWELIDERAEIRRSVEELLEHLNEHVEYYHKAIWWKMDRDRLLMMLDGFYIPGTNNVSIASVVDREPIGVIGNSLVYRVGAGSYIGYGQVKTPADLYSLYAETQPVRDPVLVSLPTDGLYAQTIMDECPALEEHFGNLDWALNDKDPELGVIDPSLLTSRRTDATPGTLPTNLPATIINLQNAPEAPPPSGLQGVLNAVTNPNAFRDMAGLAATQANAAAALTTAANLATNFGNQAAELELAKMAKAQEATRTADQKLASIQRAKEKGLTSETEAAAQAKNVLSSMNPDAPKGEAPHENKEINAAIAEAKNVPGSSIEANTGEGQVKVTVGGGKEDKGTDPLIVAVNVSDTLRALGTSSDFTGKTKLSVRGKNLPSGSQLRWSIPSSAIGRYTITQRVTASGISEVEITGIQPGLTDIDVEALDSGVVVASLKLPLSIPQFITANDNDPAFAAFITTNSLGAIESHILEEARLVIERLLLTNANVRLLWSTRGDTPPAHLPANMITQLTILDADPSGQDLYGETTSPGGSVGDTVFDETISIYPASYLATLASGTDVNPAANALVDAIMSVQQSVPDFELWAIRVFGRLLGETISHEIFHSLLSVPFVHNVDGAGNDIDTADLMDTGAFRSFRERTGIDAPNVSLPPDQLLASLVDNGVGSINALTGGNLAHIQTHFPIPPTRF